MRNLRTLGRLTRELFDFVKFERIWWLTPTLLLLVLLSVFLIVVEGSALAPLIYAMF